MYIYIRSMSETQQEVRRNIVAASNRINLHIAKILLFSDSQNVDHWMHEIWSFLYKVDKLKGKNKWPKVSFIKEALAVHNDNLEGTLEIAVDLEDGLTPSHVSLRTLQECIEKYQDWLSSELSTYGYVVQKDVKEQLRKICNL